MSQKKKTMLTRRRKYFITRTITGILILIVIFTGGIWTLSWLETHREKSRVEKIARNIELFKQQYHRLPNVENEKEMHSLEFQEHTIGWDPDFILLNQTDYELWLYYGFDGPDLVYNSKTKTWREEY